MMETYRKEDIRRGDIYYSRLLGIDSIDEYIRYGGTLRASFIFSKAYAETSSSLLCISSKPTLFT